jgi:AcrR family transcriptional regulator
VEAPAKQITDLTDVGVGTLYRHFPQRSDLVKAVVETGIDAVAEALIQWSAEDLPHAITQVSQPVSRRGLDHEQQIVAVLIDGL